MTLQLLEEIWWKSLAKKALYFLRLTDPNSINKDNMDDKFEVF